MPGTGTDRSRVAEEQLSRKGPGGAGGSRLSTSQQRALAARGQTPFWGALSTAQPAGQKRWFSSWI